MGGDSNRPSFHSPLFHQGLDGGARSESRSPRVRSCSLRCVALRCFAASRRICGGFLAFCVKLGSGEWGDIMAMRTMCNTAGNRARGMDVLQSKRVAGVGSNREVCRLGLRLEDQKRPGGRVLVLVAATKSRRRGVVACGVRASAVPVSNGAAFVDNTGMEEERIGSVSYFRFLK